MSQVAAAANNELRVQFFTYLFGDKTPGYLCIATADKEKANFIEKFFFWPAESMAAAAYIGNHAITDNIWFGVTLLRRQKRSKEDALSSSFVWADLDEVDYTSIEPVPTCVLETSAGRFQAFWRFSGDPIPPLLAEEYSRRIAYSTGADKSGWDMTQLLRVPWTYNFKYNPPQQVAVQSILMDTYEVEEFEKLAPAEQLSPMSIADYKIPEELPDFNLVLAKYRTIYGLDEEFSRLYTRTPAETEDWSRLMWRFIHICFGMSMSREEVYVIATQAACNKHVRDNRPVSYLWREVIKADQEHSHYNAIVTGKIQPVDTMPHLVDFDKIEEDAFIKEYKVWASQATDAPEQYHELTCFILLSSVICSGLWLAVDWGEIVPNLWGLMLGESTLTRKTTAMRLAVDMLKDVDNDLILATDGSAEGLLTGLSQRPGRVSIFWKDEISGLFDSINKKDYLAGLPETLTQLYDVPKVLTRLLRKETITISEPYFIFFGGGIRDKVYSLLNDEYILSGFLPRFIVVSGENDLSRFRGTGPPTVQSTERKDRIIRTITDLHDKYTPATVQVEIAGQKVDMPGPRVEARLTEDAWNNYRRIERILTHTGAQSDSSMLALPTFSRMSFSVLKMSMLVAASRREPDSANRLEVTESDVNQAAFYMEKWGHYSIELISNTGVTTAEKILRRSLHYIREHNGLTKAELMQRQRLGAKEAKEIIETLFQRGLIDAKKAGRGHRLYALGMDNEEA